MYEDIFLDSACFTKFFNAAKYLADVSDLFSICSNSNLFHAIMNF